MLDAGCRSHNFKAIYIFEPKLWELPDLSYRHYLFLKDCLESLQEVLALRGIELHIYTQEAIAVFQKLHHELGAFTLFSSQETWNDFTYQRDLAIKKWCQNNQVQWQEYTQNGVVRCLKDRDGWAGQWQARMQKTQLHFSYQSQPIYKQQSIPSAQQLGLQAETHLDIQTGGRKAAENLLGSFLNQRGKGYTKEMSSPLSAFEACSRLSTHLAFGSLSIREVYQTAEIRAQQLRQLSPKERGTWPQSIRSFLGRLRWHCHFIQKLEDAPSIEFKALHSAYRDFEKRPYNTECLQKWQAGETGFPLVDACMKALQQTGWLNFRMRALVVSTACHHLDLPWQPVAQFLATQFTDYEPGIHYSQCQMQAGMTGINTIRIYSPIKQAIDQDANGIFIKEWLPHLEKCPSEYIHQPWLWDSKLEPLVDEKNARKSAATALYALRKGEAFGTEAKKIVKKHASRKKAKVSIPSTMPLFPNLL